MIDFITNNWETIGITAAAVVTLASGIVRMTPTPKDDEWVKTFLVRLSAFWPWGELKIPFLQGMPKRGK